MKSIILIQLRTVLRRRNCIFFVLGIIICFFVQGLRLRQYFYIYEAEGNALDFLFFTIGGWQSPLLFSFILSWLLLTLSLLYISVISSTSIEEFGGMIINRIQNRVKLWATICISQFLLSLFFLSVMLVAYYFISYIFFDFNFNFTSYTFEFYESWAKSDMSIKVIVFLIGATFTSGLYSLFMLIQVVLNLSTNKQFLYRGFIFLAVATSIFYIYTNLPRIFSPLFYPSTISISFDASRIFLALYTNILISISCIMIGGVLYRKKSF